MAERRMFAKTIIDSDAFIDMPVTARLLYYDLSMRADDDGFVNAPKKIMRMIGASQDDLSVLILRKFIIPFESGVVVIRHWKIHNYIQKDRYRATTYQAEMAQLNIEDNTYTLSGKSTVSNMDTECIQTVSDMDTQDRIGKSKSKDRIEIINAPSATAPNGVDDGDIHQSEKRAKMPDIDELTDGLSEPLKTAINDWIAYKKERREPYKETGLRACISRIKGLVSVHGESAVIDAINVSMAQNWKGVYIQNKPHANEKSTENQTPPSYDLSRAEQRAKTSVPVLTKRERR